MNTHSLGSHLSLSSTLNSSLTEEEVCEFYGDDVFEVILQLKMGKADAEGIFSEHLIFASPALTEPLASFFTSLLHHGYMRGDSGGMQPGLYTESHSASAPAGASTYQSSNLSNYFLLLRS